MSVSSANELERYRYFSNVFNAMLLNHFDGGLVWNLGKGTDKYFTLTYATDKNIFDMWNKYFTVAGRAYPTNNAMDPARTTIRPSRVLGELLQEVQNAAAAATTTMAGPNTSTVTAARRSRVIWYTAVPVLVSIYALRGHSFYCFCITSLCIRQVSISLLGIFVPI